MHHLLTTCIYNYLHGKGSILPYVLNNCLHPAPCILNPHLVLQEERKKKRKITPVQCTGMTYEPVVQMLNTACRVVAWGVMPLLGGGLLFSKCSFKSKG